MMGGRPECHLSERGLSVPHAREDITADKNAFAGFENVPAEGSFDVYASEDGYLTYKTRRVRVEVVEREAAQEDVEDDVVVEAPAADQEAGPKSDVSIDEMPPREEGPAPEAGLPRTPAPTGTSESDPAYDSSMVEQLETAPYSVEPIRILPFEEELEPDFGPRLPSAQQVAAALTMLALVSPAALGGIPVLPVTIDEERRRHQDEIQQQSESSVGVYQDAQEAATALTLSQRRLAQVTREVEHSTAHNVSEADVVHAAHRVLSGTVSPHQSLRFRSALTRVATDSVDLFILESDEERMVEDVVLEDVQDDDDLDAWLAEFA